MAALGLVEVVGIVSAITTLDAMLKAAQVERLSVEKVKGGLVAVMVTGDVGAVRAAVDAGVATAQQLGTIISHHVIPRPAEMTEKMLEPLKHKKSITMAEQAKQDNRAAEEIIDEEQEATKEAITDTESEIVPETEVDTAEETSEGDPSPDSEAVTETEIDSAEEASEGDPAPDIEAVAETEIDSVEEISEGYSFLNREALENMRVVDLRKLARELDLPNLTKHEISFARKDELVREILGQLEMG